NNSLEIFTFENDAFETHSTRFSESYDLLVQLDDGETLDALIPFLREHNAGPAVGKPGPSGIRYRIGSFPLERASELLGELYAVAGVADVDLVEAV
ncbi:MAG: hypothetical protein AAF938_03480, partial [Myxococcota bacterium]